MAYVIDIEQLGEPHSDQMGIHVAEIMPQVVTAGSNYSIIIILYCSDASALQLFHTVSHAGSQVT